MPVPHGGAETEVSMTPTVTDTPTGTAADGAAGSLTTRVTELLNQEKWTRAALNSYVTSNFVELDSLLEDARKEDCETELLELCEEHLRSNRNSIIALYLSGIVSIGRRLVDDSNLVLLVNIFTDNHKWNIVEYLCNRILEFGENRFALRTLAESYDNKNEEASKLEVYERLIRVDYEEADFVKVLARNREQAGDIGGAVNYYRKALHRYINKRNYANIKEVWERLIEHRPDDTEFYLQLERKVARTVSEERAVALLEALYPHYYEKEDWDTTIEILKRILRYEPKNAEARSQIAEAYTEKHAGHSHLDEYLRISNLTQAWRNAQEAIADFEKHIAFDAGNFVFHRSWGIGRISAIDDDEITVDFPQETQPPDVAEDGRQRTEDPGQGPLLGAEGHYLPHQAAGQRQERSGGDPAFHHPEFRQSGRHEAHQDGARPPYPNRLRVVQVEHGGATHSEDRPVLRQPRGEAGHVRGARHPDLLRGEDVQQVLGGKVVLRTGLHPAGLPAERQSRLRVLQRDVLLLQRVPEGVHGGQRSGDRELPPGTADRQEASLPRHRCRPGVRRPARTGRRSGGIVPGAGQQ